MTAPVCALARSGHVGKKLRALIFRKDCRCNFKPLLEERKISGIRKRAYGAECKIQRNRNHASRRGTDPQRQNGSRLVIIYKGAIDFSAPVQPGDKAAKSKQRDRIGKTEQNVVSFWIACPHRVSGNGAHVRIDRGRQRFRFFGRNGLIGSETEQIGGRIFLDAGKTGIA